MGVPHGLQGIGEEEDTKHFSIALLVPTVERREVTLVGRGYLFPMRCSRSVGHMLLALARGVTPQRYKRQDEKAHFSLHAGLDSASSGMVLEKRADFHSSRVHFGALRATSYYGARIS